jgi:hypothetical protein
VWPLHFQVILVSIKLQRDAKTVWVGFRRSELPGGHRGFNNAKRVPHQRCARSVYYFFSVYDPFDLGIFLPDSDRLLQKGHLSMAKAIASDAKPDTAAANTMPPARDPQLAVEEEYQMARRLNTAQSLELFIARHPDDPLAARARADLRSLSR